MIENQITDMEWADVVFTICCVFRRMLATDSEAMLTNDLALNCVRRNVKESLDFPRLQARYRAMDAES